MKPTTYNELAAKGDTTTALTPLTIADLQEFVAKYSGHGWVIKREGGAVARCGGPNICTGCKMESAIVEAMKVYG